MIWSFIWTGGSYWPNSTDMTCIFDLDLFRDTSLGLRTKTQHCAMATSISEKGVLVKQPRMFIIIILMTVLMMRMKIMMTTMMITYMPPGGRGCHLSGAISGCSSPREPQQLPSGSNLAFFWNFFVYWSFFHQFTILA